MRATRKLNYTNRYKIDRSEVEIVLHDADKSPPTFSARFHFKKPLNPDARLFVEAYCADTTQRYDFGRVGAPIPPESLMLDRISLAGTIQFRVKVVDDYENKARLIASAEKIRPAGADEQNKRGSLMHISCRPLGQRVWSMEFSDDELPILLINNRIPNALARINTDKVFNALIIPQAFREVLHYLVLADREAMMDDDEGWQSKWLTFIAEFAPNKIPSEGDVELILSWIDDTVEEFCTRYGFCDDLANYLGEDA